MRAMDVMTSDVITVDENASVQAAAKLLVEHRISAVPVVDKDNQVIGMVSEGDLLHRTETGTEQRRSCGSRWGPRPPDRSQSTSSRIAVRWGMS